METNNTEEGYTEDNCSQAHQERLYKCEACEKGYASKRMLYEHRRCKHIGVKYSCNKCEYQATKQSNLARHQASKHEGVKYSCCEFTCEATFTTEWDMRKHHEYKHNSAENYCNECEYKSSISSNLIRHKRLKHGKNETPVAKTNQTKLVMILFWKLVTLKKLTLKSTNLRPVKVAMHLKECFITTHGLNIVVPDILATNVNIRQQNKVTSTK